MTEQKIKEKAAKLGYLGCGIIPVNSFEEYTRALDERVKAFPASKELYEPLYSFAKQPDNAKSIIVCTQRFNKYKPVESLKGLVGKCYQYDPRIPYSYEHRAQLEFEAYLKTLGITIIETPVPVRWAAVKAGLGKFGRNNFFYDKDHGSNVWIQSWVIDRELAYDAVSDDIYLSDCNNGCNRCMASCPTKALSDEFTMDMGKCITYLFSNADAQGDDNLKKKMGKWIYGCDVCQDACPHNKDKYNESEEFPLLQEISEFMTPERILEMDEETYRNVVNPRFWYVGDDGLALWKQNAQRALKK